MEYHKFCVLNLYRILVSEHSETIERFIQFVTHQEKWFGKCFRTNSMFYRKPFIEVGNKKKNKNKPVPNSE
jgi:hypothetical protein